MEPEVAMVVTELEIEKNKDFDLGPEHVARTCAAVAARLQQRPA
jgi:uncharacterized metal-binding protein